MRALPRQSPLYLIRLHFHLGHSSERVEGLLWPRRVVHHHPLLRRHDRRLHRRVRDHQLRVQHFHVLLQRVHLSLRRDQLSHRVHRLEHRRVDLSGVLVGVEDGGGDRLHHLVGLHLVLDGLQLLREGREGGGRLALAGGGWGQLYGIVAVADLVGSVQFFIS